MTTQEITDKYQEILNLAPGDNETEQLHELLKSYLRYSLKECSEEIANYEAKFGMSFDEFQEALEDGKLGDPYKYNNELAKMEWQSLCEEKKQLKMLLRQLVEEDKLPQAS